jgi:hypothetical protein
MVGSAILQLLGLAVLFSRRNVTLVWRSLAATLLRSTAASFAMAGVIVLVLGKIEVASGTWNAMLRVILPTAAGMATYGALIVTIEHGRFIRRG